MTASWPAKARHWSQDELVIDSATAIAEFRARRLGEPLQRYLDAYDANFPVNRDLIGCLREVLADAETSRDVLQTLWATESGRTAFRYLGAPPISDADLATLAEASPSAAAARDVTGKRRRLIDVIRVIADPRRFPWIPELREPTNEELQAAARRPAEGVKSLLNDSPSPGTFLTQINVGSDNADVLVRLADGRLLAVECKGSNSEINSRKRLNKEAAKNAHAWMVGFGGQVVPAVALQGVFSVRYLVEAQDTPMLIFWGHRLDDLKAFIQASS